MKYSTHDVIIRIFIQCNKIPRNFLKFHHKLYSKFAFNKIVKLYNHNTLGMKLNTHG